MRSVRHIGRLSNFNPSARPFYRLRNLNRLEAAYGLFSETDDHQPMRGSAFLLILNAWLVIGVARNAFRRPKPDADSFTHTSSGVLSPLRLESLRTRLCAFSWGLPTYSRRSSSLPVTLSDMLVK